MEGAPIDQDQRFAEWYVWAKREISTDGRVCLGAAQAVVEALEAGADEHTARLTARRSTSAGHGYDLVKNVPPRRRAYAEWYDWARREVGGDRARLHTAADAAMQRLDAGGDAAQAAQAAHAAVGPNPAMPGPIPPAPPEAVPPPSLPEASAAVPPPPPTEAPSPADANLPPPPLGQYLPPASPASAPSHAYAGFGRRLAAYVIDSVLITIGLTLLGFVILVFVGFGLLSSGQDPTNIGLSLLVEFTIVLIFLVLTWLYYAGLESSAWQGTVGKRLMKMVVTDLQGKRIGFGRASARYFAKILSWILFIGFLMIPFSPRQQGLHDMIAGTLTVRQEHLGLVAGAPAHAPVQPQGA